MALTQLLILRHGQSEQNRGGCFNGASSPLTPLGKQQALAAAEAICQQPLDAIYTSDLPRALETAQAVELRSGLTAKRTAALRERSLGDYEGLPLERIAAEQPDFWRSLMHVELHALPPGGESRDMCVKRFWPLLTTVLTAHHGGRVALVSHRMLIDHLLRELLGLCAVPSPCSILETDNAALHHLEFRGDRMFVIRLNDTSHLAALALEIPKNGDGRAL